MNSQTAETSSKIYFINCSATIQPPLLGCEVSAKYANNLSSIIEMHADVLVEKEADAILRRCGLSSKTSCIQNLANEGGNVHKPLSEVEEMSPQALSGCLRTFYGLVMGNDRLLPEFEKLQEPKLRSNTCIRVAYRLLYEVITDPRNQYADPKFLVRHSPGQIKIMLEI